MPPKSPLDAKYPNRKKTKSENAEADGKDEHSAHLAPPPITSSAYEEAQNDEIQVLQSVYPEEYEDVQSKSAWSKPTDKSFKLRLKAPSDALSYVVLAATLTATYPKTVPLLTIEDHSNVRSKVLDKVKSTIMTLPKTLLGEVMMYEIASTIQDMLEDAVIARAQEQQMPSLEEERARHEAEAAKAAQKLEEEAFKRQEAQKAEEDQALQRMIAEEQKRRDEAERKRQYAETIVDEDVAAYSRPHVVFDREIEMLDDHANPLIFKGAGLGSIIAQGPTSLVISASPMVEEVSSIMLVLKRLNVDKCPVPALILRLEDELEKLRSIEHGNIIRVFDFKITANEEKRQVDVLTEHANDGTLLGLLRKAGPLSPDRSRKIAIDVLQGLDHYHKRGLFHADLHAGNVLLSSSPNGDITAKLSDATFQASLQALKRESLKGVKKHRKPGDGPDQITSGWCCSGRQSSRGSDVWYFGVLLAQMLFGAEIIEQYSTPQSFLTSANLSSPLIDLLCDTFKSEEKKRPSALELIPYEFLRTNAPATVPSRSSSALGLSRMSSTNLSRRVSKPEPMSNVSRFATEYGEISRIGKGGYGEVVKAKNKNDNNFYAIKKIAHKTPAELSRVLPEVHLLANLSHPYVVRYITNWTEEESSPQESVETSTADLTSTETNTNTKASTFGFGESTGGLDFVSSSGYHHFEFDHDDDEDDEEDSDESDESDEDESSQMDSTPDKSISGPLLKPNKPNPLANGNPRLAFQRLKSDPKTAIKSTLYIQMEFCERLTLRDIIRKNVYDNDDDLWRFFKQILEGLVHVHSHGIIHRDLKPENIFIDKSNNPKIGDFGLAKTGHFDVTEHHHENGSLSTEMTRSVGTTLYVAPELRSDASGDYTNKVDMYSLGIIFFEMCYPLKTSMERIHSIQALRLKSHTLPGAFQAPESAVKGEIILSLVNHRPADRPTSAELARSPKLPVRIEDEQVQLALSGLSDPNSPYYHRMMAKLFQPSTNELLRDETWEMGSEAHMAVSEPYNMLQNFVKDRMMSVFKRHGLLEISRQGLFPRSKYYTAGNVMTLLDASGNLLQLPYDLTLPHARAIAKQNGNIAKKVFTFANVFREAPIGGAPRSNREADVDIMSADGRNLALDEAEIIKILDEVLDELPSFRATPMCFHLSHSALLDLILEFCRVLPTQKAAAKEILGRLNIQTWTWQKIRTELRAPSIAISSTSLDELSRFDFRDTPEKCFVRLQTMFSASEYLPKLHAIYTHIGGLDAYLKRLGVRRKVYVNPLGSFNDKFYADAIMFQCLFDGKKRDVLAAGGRYDSLIESFKPHVSNTSTGTEHGSFHSVGMNIAWDRLVTSMSRFLKSPLQPGAAFLKRGSEDTGERRQDETAAATAISSTMKRCDVLVASFDTSLRLDFCLSVLILLWSHDISAELAVEGRTPEEILSHYRDAKDGTDGHSWMITVKHKPNPVAKPELKVKNLEKKEDVDLRVGELVTFLRAEIRERDQRLGTKSITASRQPTAGSAIPSLVQANSSGGFYNNPMPVHVLPIRDRDVKGSQNRRTPKYREIEMAQQRARSLAQSYMDLPIASISCTNETLDAIIRQTRISDGEGWRDSWRKVANDAFPEERGYLTGIQNLIEKLRREYQDAKSCWIYNDRTGRCVLYDLGKD